MLKFGIISDAKPDKGLYRVKIDEEDITTDWLSVLARNTLKVKDEIPLYVNEHVALLMDEMCENGVILGAMWSEADTPASGAGEDIYRKTFEDGTFIQYDKGTGEVTVDGKGSVIVKSAKNVEITCSKLIVNNKVEITGDVKITGNTDITGLLDVTQDITSSGGDVVAFPVTLKTHKHAYVAPSGPAITGPSQP